MARSLVNGRNLQHWDVKVMHFSFSYDAPITACARNSRNYTYFLTKYTRYLQVTYLAEKYIEIWHNTYISCCVCMYVCNRMYIRIRIVLYPYTNFWHDSHKTYQKYLPYAWKLWAWPAPNFSGLQKVSPSSETWSNCPKPSMQNLLLLGRLNPDPLTCSQSTYPSHVLPCIKTSWAL